jgi:ferric-dicitrate binding protein FerR (iron transport regulator)
MKINNKIFDILGGKSSENGELLQRILDALMDDNISPRLRADMQRIVIGHATEEQLGEAFARYAEECAPAYGLKLEGEALASYNKVARRLGLKQVAENPLALDSNLTRQNNNRTTEPLRKPRRLAMLWRIAAVLIPAAMVIGGYFIINRDNREFLIAKADHIQQVFLPDSTRITVEAGSSVIYRETDSIRVITLSGDAFFDVKRDTLKPFHVSTSNLHLSVLGTEFHVSETPAVVSLFEGSVAVDVGAESRILSWGERLTYDPATGEVDVSIITANEMMAQEYKPRLIFDHATLGEVLDALSASFDTDILTAADVNRSEGALTLDLENMTLTQAIEFLIKVTREDLSFTSADGTVYITRNN